MGHAMAFFGCIFFCFFLKSVEGRLIILQLLPLQSLWASLHHMM